MDFHFWAIDQDSGDLHQRAIVHVSIDPDHPVLRFDVDLDQIPLVEDGGIEVIANFHVHNFDNNGTFYTDSNGLEM